MNKVNKFIFSYLLVAYLFAGFSINAQTIVTVNDASITEEQAAKEIRRYIFLRTGTAPELTTAENYSSLPEGDVIVVSENSRGQDVAVGKGFRQGEIIDTDGSRTLIVFIKYSGDSELNVKLENK